MFLVALFAFKFRFSWKCLAVLDFFGLITYRFKSVLYSNGRICELNLLQILNWKIFLISVSSEWEKNIKWLSDKNELYKSLWIQKILLLCFLERKKKKKIIGIQSLCEVHTICIHEFHSNGLQSLLGLLHTLIIASV